MLTQERLKELLHYDLETGEFTWIKKSAPKSNIKIGSKADCVGPDGYIRICVERKQYRGHQLAALYVTGSMIEQVDHIDNNRSNNSWANLRYASQLNNTANAKKAVTNTTGVKGVTLDKKSKLYIAQVFREGIRYRRCFKTLNEASEWLVGIREVLHGEFTNHG